jgi:hypothetical protein
MKCLLYVSQPPEFREARSSAKFRNISKAGGPATALISVEKQILFVDVSSFQPKRAVVL